MSGERGADGLTDLQRRVWDFLADTEIEVEVSVIADYVGAHRFAVVGALNGLRKKGLASSRVTSIGTRPLWSCHPTKTP